MIEELFEAIDRKDVESFLSFLSPRCQFRFGNLPEVVGEENIRQFIAGFFDSIAALSHQLIESFEVPDGLICHGQVTYTRVDGSSLSVPFANIMNLDEQGICEYLIFADTSTLYPSNA